MQRTRYVLLILLLVSFLSACSPQPTQVPPTAAPAQTVQSGRGITSEERELPLTDAEVPRLSLEEAKAALDSGAAILVDVRSPDAFAASHAVGAISVPLGEIERNISSLPLEKDQWIITYCT